MQENGLIATELNQTYNKIIITGITLKWNDSGRAKNYRESVNAMNTQ